MSTLTIESLSSLPETILVAPGEKRIFLAKDLSSDLSRTIRIAEWAECSIYGFFTSGTHSIEIIHEWPKSKSYCGLAMFAGDTQKVDLRVAGMIRSSESDCDLHILSLAGSGWESVIDGSITVDHGVIGSSGLLRERHVFLGSSGKIRGIPALLVHSDDVRANHSLAIDRVSDEELFYLRSRGFSREDATVMMLESAIVEAFSSFGHRFPSECHALAEEIMGCVRTLIVG